MGRTVQIQVGVAALREMLRLPREGEVKLAAVEGDTLTLHVSHPALPEVSDGELLPMADVVVTTQPGQGVIIGAVLLKAGETVIPGQGFVYPQNTAPDSVKSKIILPGYRPGRGPVTRVG